MAVVMKKLVRSYIHAMTEWADPRADDLVLMGSPFSTIAIVLTYLYYVLHFGPIYMRNRKPYQLNNVLTFYNVLQIICSGYIFYELFEYVVFKYRWRCAPVDFSNGPEGVKILNTIWCYFLLKLFDLLDTVFFVLRKKYNQVSFLHVYHHTGMVVMLWIGTKFVGGGHSVYLPFVNSFVHCVMYFYYLLSARDKSIQQNLWLKKSITQMQLFQFAILFVTYTHLLFRPTCLYPKWCSLLLAPQYLFITLLFLDFYIKSYIRKPKQIAKKEDELKRIYTKHELFFSGDTYKYNGRQ